ncbi:hypothetical protein BKM63_00300 [Flavobacterium johnsoniae]|uniref:Uncharacterized protein n=1 Tax=Flavobacterium johnsoniae TaxID=986 RepID=A0A1J7CQ36_FLAJO|nr:hypothetical protein BKM63_00300 [Flavobacterium johnsoniae]
MLQIKRELISLAKERRFEPFVDKGFPEFPRFPGIPKNSFKQDTMHSKFRFVRTRYLSIKPI